MFSKSWIRQIQAVIYILLIVLLYGVLDQYILKLSETYQDNNTDDMVFSELIHPYQQNKEEQPDNQEQNNQEQQDNEEQKDNQEQNQQESQYDILIDLSESMLYLFENNRLIHKYPVAQGKTSTPSPIGIWSITNKARNWGSGFGTRWMGLDVPWGMYGIHGTNKPGSIGRRASAGCFRMRNKDVEELYSIVPYKTKVIVYGGPYGNMGASFEKLEPGDRKSQVAEVQKRLQKLGYYKGSIDGIFGEGMKAALIQFKRDNNLPNDHYVDWATYKALGIMPFE